MRPLVLIGPFRTNVQDTLISHVSDRKLGTRELFCELADLDG